MDYAKALKKLGNHANMPGLNLPENESFLFTVREAERQSQVPDLQNLFEDMMDCLVAVNHVLNTENPSETIEGKFDALQRPLVSYVSSILLSAWGDYYRWSRNHTYPDSFREQFAAMLLQLGMAWDAVLAGDIDDIREHVELEYAIRFKVG